VNLMRGMFETAGQRRVEERNYALAREAKAGEDLAESHRTAQKRAAAVAKKAAAQAQQSCADKLAAAQARATAAVIEITNGAESAQREKMCMTLHFTYLWTTGPKLASAKQVELRAVKVTQ